MCDSVSVPKLFKFRFFPMQVFLLLNYVLLIYFLFAQKNNSFFITTFQIRYFLCLVRIFPVHQYFTKLLYW